MRRVDARRGELIEEQSRAKEYVEELRREERSEWEESRAEEARLKPVEI